MALAITKYLDAGYPVLYVRTQEHNRAVDEIIADLKHGGLADNIGIMVWKSTTGLYDIGARNPKEESVAESLLEALQWIASVRDGNQGPDPDKLYIVLNPKEFLKNPIVLQQLKDAAYAIRAVSSYIVMVGCGMDMPEEIEDVVTVLDLELPDKAQIKSIFQSVITAYADALEHKPDAAELETAAENALGLSAFKAENAISLSIVSSKGIDIPLIRKEKQLAVKQTGVLEYIHHTETMDTLGGFDNLKEHVMKRRRYFSNHKAALEFGLKPPKGLMLVGQPGTGKSLSAKCVSAALDLPLYKFDVGAVFKGVVGGSEAAIRYALKLAEKVAPCVLLIDEMEKLMAGLESSGKSDSGVTSRVIGTLISWMQETSAPIYKLATCNTIRNLDAALFRRGRWDAVFAVDLPTAKEREQIFAIHLTKRGRDVTAFDLPALAGVTVDFVGAEIESVVDEAMYVAFDAGRELQTDDLATVAKSVVPISKTDAEGIADFRRWMSNRAMPVSKTADVGKPAGKLRNLRVSG